MEVPQTFKPKKSKSIESLLEEPEQKYNPIIVEKLLSRSEQFLKKTGAYDELYQEGIDLTDLKYTLKDVEDLSKRIRTGQSRDLGIYFSALINNIITEKDTIVLTLDEKLDGIGMYLQKGTVIVEGNTNDCTGYCMEGGKLTVEGNTNDNTGDYMEGGKLTVEGNTNDCTGYCMEGGKLTVKGKIASISDYFKKGTIIEGTKIVRQA